MVRKHLGPKSEGKNTHTHTQFSRAHCVKRSKSELIALIGIGKAMADLETNGSHEPGSLLIPCIKSLKRTYDLFLVNHLNPIKFSDDLESQRLKLYSKVQDEYAMVRDLPPPAPPSKAITVVTTTP